MSDFRDAFEDFRRIFQGERSYVVPSLSVNTKGATEMLGEGKILVEYYQRLCKLNYLFEANRGFSLDELVWPLTQTKVLSIAASLRCFLRPNHKDRFTHLVHFLANDPERFAQIVYLSLVQCCKEGESLLFSEDDAKFFCFSTFPSTYMFFLTEHDCMNAVKFIESLFQLHFHVHGFQFGRSHQFLRDMISSFFLTTNPGRFFDHVIQPLIPLTCIFTEEKELKYRSDPVIRLLYWRKVADFVNKICEKMTQCATLLPDSARIMIKHLIELQPAFPAFKYIAIIESFICTYISKYVNSHQDQLMRDAATVLLCLCPMPHPMQATIAPALNDVQIDIDAVISALAGTRNVSEEMTDAMNAAGRFTIITTRDLTLLFMITENFAKYVPEENSKPFTSILSGIMAPKKSSETDLLQLRVWLTDPSLQGVTMLPTQPYDEITDVMNMVDISKLEYSSASELREIVMHNCKEFITPYLEQKLSTEALENTTAVLSNISHNVSTLKAMSEKTFSSLFACKNEAARCLEQLKSLAAIHTKRVVVPSLFEAFPDDFIFDHADIFAPLDSYDRLIKAVDGKIQELKIADYNSTLIKKVFFMNFIDQIDIAFEWQNMIKTDYLRVKFSEYCQTNAQLTQSLTLQRRRTLSSAAMGLQWIRRTHTISYNLSIVLNALNMLTIFPENIIKMAIVLSGNPDIHCFTYFVSKYLADKRIADVVMTKKEQKLLESLRKAMQHIVQTPPHVL